MVSYGCGNRCGCDMNYIGDGDWECPKCGRVIHFGAPDDDDDDEGIDVYTAADIWMSSGKDEDSTFGYTIQQLERALND